MICPRCGSKNFELIQDEVDIGVGVQTHTRGGECADCGPVACCAVCGGWEVEKNILAHEPWCPEAQLQSQSAPKPLTKECAAEMNLTYHVQRTGQEPIEVPLDEYLTYVGMSNPVPRFFMTPGMRCWISGPDERKLV